jgi:hypothetical protein
MGNTRKTLILLHQGDHPSPNLVVNCLHYLILSALARVFLTQKD